MELLHLVGTTAHLDSHRDVFKVHSSISLAHQYCSFVTPSSSAFLNQNGPILPCFEMFTRVVHFPECSGLWMLECKGLILYLCTYIARYGSQIDVYNTTTPHRRLHHHVPQQTLVALRHNIDIRTTIVLRDLLRYHYSLSFNRAAIEISPWEKVTYPQNTMCLFFFFWFEAY